MAMMTAPVSPAIELRADEHAAWREYLDTTRNEIGCRYLEVEPWAWSRLQTRLRLIAARRRDLAAKT